MNGRRFGNEFTPSSAYLPLFLLLLFSQRSLPLPRFFFFFRFTFFSFSLSLFLSFARLVAALAVCVCTYARITSGMPLAGREGDVTALSGQPKRRSAACTVVGTILLVSSCHRVATVVDLRDSSRIFCLKKTRLALAAPVPSCRRRLRIYRTSRDF